MSEFKEADDRKFGQYVLNSSIDLSGSNINAEELANACRHLGISGPLEPLLRDLKIKNDKYVSPVSPATNKDSPQRKSTSQRKEGNSKRLSSSQWHSPDYHLYEHSDSVKGSAGGGGSGSGGYGKNSYGKESWGRDSGARDLSPEPNSMHRMHETLATENPPMMDTETCGGGGGGSGGGTSAMLHLASKVSQLYFR